MADDSCERCYSVFCWCENVERDVTWLLKHADWQRTLSNRYAGQYDILCQALRDRVLATAKAERERCAEYVRAQGTHRWDYGQCQILADELERMPES